MFRGSHEAKLDDKGRLKVPTRYRRLLEESHGNQVFITSLTGDHARIYPMPIWEAIERKVALLPSMDESVSKFLELANYYGQEGEVDAQGRVLIHPSLRKQAELTGNLKVVGKVDYLEVWDLGKIDKRIQDAPYNKQDAAALAALGI